MVPRNGIFPKTPFEKVLEITGWLTLIAMWVLAFYCYESLPENIPLYFNAEGPGDYGHKMTLLVLPGVVTIVFAGLTLLSRYPHFFNHLVRVTPENAALQLQNAPSTIRWLKLVIVAVASMVILMIFNAARGDAQMQNPLLIIAILALILFPVVTFTIRSLAVK